MSSEGSQRFRSTGTGSVLNPTHNICAFNPQITSLVSPLFRLKREINLVFMELLDGCGKMSGNAFTSCAFTANCSRKRRASVCIQR